MNRDNPPRPKCPVCRARKEPTTLLCSACYRAFERIKAAPGESTVERLCRLADWAIRRAVRLERARARALGCRMIAQMRAEPNEEPLMATDDATKIARVIAALDDEPVTDAEARETCERLGIDVPAWAAEIRAKVAANHPEGTTPGHDSDCDCHACRDPWAGLER